MLHRVGEDLRIRRFRRRLDRAREHLGRALGRRAPLRAKLGLHGEYRELARHLAGRGAAEPVGDHEQRAVAADEMRTHLGLQRCIVRGEVGNEKGILVVIANAADIGSAEHVHDHFTGHGVGLRVRAGHGYKVCEMALTCTLAMRTTRFRRPWDGTMAFEIRVNMEHAR